MLVEELDAVIPPKITDQAVPLGSPPSVNVTACADWKFAVIVPGALIVKEVEAEAAEAITIELEDADHETNW